MKIPLICSLALLCASAQSRHIVKASATRPSPQRQEAIDALKALRSVTSAGISYREYSPRVLDAKVKVDSYLESSSDPFPVRHGIGVAMREYQLASAIWNSSIFESGVSITNGLKLSEDLDISKCGVLADHVKSRTEAVKAQPTLLTMDGKAGDIYALSIIGGETATLQPLWSCAAAQIAEAEKALGSK